MTTGKTIALTRWTFVDKVMSLTISMLVWNLAPRAVLQIETLKTWIEVVTEGKMVDEEEQSRKDLWGTLTLNAR